MPDQLVIAFTNEASNRRRFVFERRQPGGWLRVEEEWGGDGWREVGSEIVSDIDVRADPGTSDVVSTTDSESCRVVTGP